MKRNSSKCTPKESSKNKTSSPKTEHIKKIKSIKTNFKKSKLTKQASSETKKATCFLSKIKQPSSQSTNVSLKTKRSRSWTKSKRSSSTRSYQNNSRIATLLLWLAIKVESRDQDSACSFWKKVLTSLYQLWLIKLKLKRFWTFQTFLNKMMKEKDWSLKKGAEPLWGTIVKYLQLNGGTRPCLTMLSLMRSCSKTLDWTLKTKIYKKKSNLWKFKTTLIFLNLLMTSGSKKSANKMLPKIKTL